MQIYSNGLSEIILGNAIKKLNIPREEVVVLTKVCSTVTRSCAGTHDCFFVLCRRCSVPSPRVSI